MAVVPEFGNYGRIYGQKISISMQGKGNSFACITGAEHHEVVWRGGKVSYILMLRNR